VVAILPAGGFVHRAAAWRSATASRAEHAGPSRRLPGELSVLLVNTDAALDYEVTGDRIAQL